MTDLKLFEYSYKCGLNKDNRDFLSLFKIGWYPSMGLPLMDVRTAAQLLRKAGRTAADEYLVGLYRARSELVQAQAVGRFPRRASIVSKSFAAIDHGDYDFSIPVLLIQIDGICFDEFGGELFLKEGNPSCPKCAAHFSSGDFIDIYLNPLKASTAISENEKRFNPNAGPINRHEILHGKNCSYGTLVNACKVISLLDLVQCACELKPKSSNRG